MRQLSRTTRYNVPTMFFLMTSYERDPCAVSVVRYVGFISSVWLACVRTAASSGTLVNGLAKIRAAREYAGASIDAHTPEWEERFLKTSMALSTVEAYEYVRQIDRTGKIADSPNHRIQKAATTLLCDTIQNRYACLSSWICSWHPSVAM